MAFGIEKRESGFVLMDGSDPATTPMGSPVASRHEELFLEIFDDVAHYGLDPSAKLTLYSLQATYIDFGRAVPREDLEENVFLLWPHDLFVHRPADPMLSMPLTALWGPPDVGPDQFRDGLSQLRLRQLMAVMVAGQALGSAVLGWKLVTSDSPDLRSLAMGACDRHFSWLGKGAGQGSFMLGGGARRYEPYAVDARDPSYCREHCCSKRAKPDADFEKLCDLYVLLDRIRRFAAFPEE